MGDSVAFLSAAIAVFVRSLVALGASVVWVEDGPALVSKNEVKESRRLAREEAKASGAETLMRLCEGRGLEGASAGHVVGETLHAALEKGAYGHRKQFENFEDPARGVQARARRWAPEVV